VLRGALNAAACALVPVIQKRNHWDDCLTIVVALGQVRPEVPQLLT
jgi:hypothetical protein